jgi:NitT/TauT family transport system permease protein
VRIAASVGLIVVISAELLAGGGEGIGMFLNESQSGGGNTEIMLAGACWAGLLGLAANAALVGLERVAFRWNTARVEGVS